MPAKRVGASGAARDRYMLALGLRIRALREARGITQSDCAERCGLGADVVSRLENGRYTNPGLRTLIRVAEGLALRPSELLPDAPEPQQIRGPQARIAALLNQASPKQLALLEDLTQSILKHGE